MKKIIAVTGGIGTGKSVVCHALRALGFPVYDCDSQAKVLMDSDPAMKQRIVSEISPEALNPDDTLNRAAISKVVFSNPAKLKKLNTIVHGAVRDHFIQWAKTSKSQTVYVETAILYESGFNRLVTDIWEVTALLETRISRIMQRNGLNREAILSRISSQSSETHSSHKLIVNDDKTALLPQILHLTNLK